MTFDLSWLEQGRELDCAVCGYVGTGSQLAEVDFRGVGIILPVRCPQCATIVVLGPKVDNETLADEHIDRYLEVGAGLDAISAVLPTTLGADSLLDVGCHYGLGLALAEHLYGWRCVGVEPSPAGTRGARELGLDIRTENLSGTTVLPGPFDVVLASEVLEHVPDPRAFLALLASQLSDRGCLVLTTPDAAAFDPSRSVAECIAVLSPGMHHNLFTEETLIQMVRDAGFGSVVTANCGQTLYLRATRNESVTLGSPLGEPVPAAALAGFYRAVLERAEPNSVLATGMQVRLLRTLVNSAQYEAAAQLRPGAHATVRARMDLDLRDPATAAAQVRDGHPFGPSLVGYAHALGFLALLHDNDPVTAADHFDLVAAAVEATPPRENALDADARDLYISAVCHRVLALAQSDSPGLGPAIDTALATLDRTVAGPRNVETKLRAFVELAARGSVLAGQLAADAAAHAPRLAASTDPASRQLGLDALYCLATHSANQRELAQSALWTVTARELITQQEATAHSKRLDEALAANSRLTVELALSAQAAAPADDPPAPDSSPASPTPTWTGAAHGIDCYWVDEAGTYLAGWIHAGGPRVNLIELRRGDANVSQAPAQRSDLAQFWPDLPDVIWAGFELYLAGSPTSPIELIAYTDSGEVRVLPTMPRHPLPYSERDESSYTTVLGEAVASAPEGPVLAIGLRSADGKAATVLREQLGGREVVVVDIHPGTDVDAVVDVHDLAAHFPRDHFAMVVSESLLEHLHAPWLAADQIRAVCKPGAIVWHGAPFAWPEHSQPNDFWRFTPAGLAELFGPRTGYEVLGTGGVGNLRLHPAAGWITAHESMPTLATAATSWVVARAVPGWQPGNVSWPYDPQADLEAAREYPVTALQPPAPEAVAEPSATPLRISVVLPLYNGRHYLPGALASIAAQTRLPDQLVVVDDGSTDGGADLLRDHAMPFEVVVIRQPNAGQSAARNAGIAAATGEIIALLDQDDQWQANHLAALSAPFAGNPELAWCYSDFDEIDQDGKTITHRFLAEAGVPNPKSSLNACLCADLLVLPSASLIRRSVILEVGGFDPELIGYEDDDLFVRVFVSGWRHQFIPESTLRYRIHPGGASASNRFLASRMHYIDKLLAAFPADHRINRDIGQDIVLPRFRATTLNEYSQALALRDYERAAQCHDALTEMSRLQHLKGPRDRVALAMLAHPRRMRSTILLAERLPRQLRPFRSGQVNLGTRTAVRAERRG